MGAGALLDHRDRAPDAAERLEIAQQDDGVGQIGDVDRLLHVADQAVLRDGEEGRRALAVQVLQQLVHMQDQELLLGHRRLIAVEAVDHDGADAVACRRRRAPDARTRPAISSAASICSMNSLPASRIACRSMPSALARVEQQPELLVENEQRGALAARDRLPRCNAGSAAICRCRPARAPACSIRARCRRPAARRARRCRC